VPVGVGVAHFLGGLLHQRCRQYHVAWISAFLCHALQSAQPNRAMADGDGRHIL